MSVLDCVEGISLLLIWHIFQVDSDAQFAAVLTAKLYSLDSVRGSPEPLEEYENPSSMETQVNFCMCMNILVIIVAQYCGAGAELTLLLELLKVGIPSFKKKFIGPQVKTGRQNLIL